MPSLRILALGDVVGRPGRLAVHRKLPDLVRSLKIDLVIANGENIAGGTGITQNLFHKLRSYGVDVVTLGDHVYKKLDIVGSMNSERLVRPANLSAEAAGRGHTVVTTAAGVPVCVFALLGRVFMNHMPANDPFAAADVILARVRGQAKVVVCDMHAEASSEKVAMGHYLDGRASLVFGTHTHVPTADAKVLAGGTAFVSDLGMCGPYDSVLGRRKDRVIKHMTTNMPHAFDVATGDVRVCGVVAEIDPATGKAKSIERVEVQDERAEQQAYDEDDKAPPFRGGAGGD